MTKTILITGASGKIGRHAAKAFSAAGWQERKFQRGTDMTQAALGADVILNGMNPPNYHNWATIIPAITRQTIAAAQASGAMVIIPGNVYNFGAGHGGIWDENTPHRPTTRKGKIRVDMERAYRDSGVQTLILRAGNFIDPEGDDDVLSLIHLRGLHRGRLALAGPAKVRQAWCYLPDWAQAAVELAEMRAMLDQFNDVPFGGLNFSGDDLKVAISTHTGKTLRLSQFPWWVMSLLAPFWELVREMAEMRPLFHLDHGLSDAKLRRLLPNFRHSNLTDALSAKLLHHQSTATSTQTNRFDDARSTVA